MTTDRWSPTRNAVVRISPHRHPEDEPPLPAGRWRIIDRAPDPSGGGDNSFWWLIAADEQAQSWVINHLSQTKSGCITYPTRRLDPVNRTK